MENRLELIKAFRETRITGEKLLSEGRITWDEHVFTMLGFEAELRNLGVNL